MVAEPRKRRSLDVSAVTRVPPTRGPVRARAPGAASNSGDDIPMASRGCAPYSWGCFRKQRHPVEERLQTIPEVAVASGGKDHEPLRPAVDELRPERHVVHLVDEDTLPIDSHRSPGAPDLLLPLRGNDHVVVFPAIAGTQRHMAAVRQVEGDGVGTSDPDHVDVGVARAGLAVDAALVGEPRHACAELDAGVEG